MQKNKAVGEAFSEHSKVIRFSSSFEGSLMIIVIEIQIKLKEKNT